MHARSPRSGYGVVGPGRGGDGHGRQGRPIDRDLHVRSSLALIALGADDQAPSRSAQGPARRTVRPDEQAATGAGCRVGEHLARAGSQRQAFCLLLRSGGGGDHGDAVQAQVPVADTVAVVVGELQGDPVRTGGPAARDGVAGPGRGGDRHAPGPYAVHQDRHSRGARALVALGPHDELAEGAGRDRGLGSAVGPHQQRLAPARRPVWDYLSGAGRQAGVLRLVGAVGRARGRLGQQRRGQHGQDDGSHRGSRAGGAKA